MIPGLPDESKGESGAPVNSCFWEWKPEFSVHYEKAGCETLGSLPVMFLPDFGVGSFHYEKQLKELGLDFRVRAKQLNGWCVYLYLDGMYLDSLKQLRLSAYILAADFEP